ncbi:MAG: leucine-rich repeat protein [Bacteroidaceae bacterium]|nr:leucine-rich repeat protein [Bacteroidaceae bacterium]
MKKLYLLLVMLCVATGLQAYNRDWTAQYGVNFVGPQQPDVTQTVITTKPGALADWASNQAAELGYWNSASSGRKLMYIEGPINADDIRVITNSEYLGGASSKYTVIDFSKTTGYDFGSDPDNLLQGFKNGKIVIVPNNQPNVGTLKEEWADYSKSGKNNYPFIGFYTDENHKQLHVNLGGANDDNGSNLSKLAGYVHNDMSLTILPGDEGGTIGYLNTNNSPTIRDNYLNGLKDLELGCIDLSWFNISSLAKDLNNKKYDFSILENASHLVIPMNNNDLDFINPNQFTYSDNTKTVALATNKAYGNGTVFVMGGQTIEIEDHSATTVFVREKGSLDDAYNYWTPNLKNSQDYYVCGEIDNDDITALSNLTSTTTLDLHQATLAEGTDVKSYGNNIVKYLALPDGQNEAINAVSPEQCTFYPKCENLLCVAAYDPTSNTLTSFSSQTGAVRNVTSIISPANSGRYGSNFALGLANLVMSGKLNHDDIDATDGSETAALNNARPENADLSKVIFPDNNDMVFSNAGPGWESLVHIDLPTDESMTALPDEFIHNLQKVVDLCIPSNYKTIGKNAFNNCLGLTHIYTEDVVAGDGKSDHGNNTLTFPPHLESVGAGAFENCDRFTDIYITTPTDEPAPTCEVGAFDATSLWGDNSTFDGGRNWNRVQKHNDGILSYAIAYLHWPTTDNQERNMVYTDVTRNYSIPAEEGVVDDDGDLIYFPDQAEYNRSYIQGTYGYTWEAWPTETNSYTSNEGGYSYYGIINPGLPSSQEDMDATVVDKSKTFDKKYAGWHQFVLSKNVAYQPTVESPVVVKENDWYTICSPYDLTKQELLELFGTKYDADATAVVNGETITENKYPEVVTLMGVKRDKTNLQVTLQFTHDLVANNEQWNFDNYQYVYDPSKPEFYVKQSGDDPVIIKAGYPYMIKPYLSVDDLAAAQSGAVKYFVGSKQKASAPVETYAVYAFNEDGKSVGVNDTEDYQNHYCYEFVGTFEKTAVPAYAYYFGKSTKQINPKTGKGQHMYFRHTGTKAKNWSANSCIIAPKVTKTKDVKDQWGNSVKVYDYSLSADDSFVINNEVKLAGFSMSFAFDDASTGIEEIEAASSNNVDNKIYSISGQFVGDSLNGLSKGLYIVNGKKYLVK